MGRLQANYNASKNNRISINKQNLGGGTIKANLNIYLYIASGSSLSPNINGLRFYDSGLASFGKPIYYDETNTYQLFLLASATSWTIIAIAGGAGNFAKLTGSDPDSATTAYIGLNGWFGSVYISAI